MTLQRVTTAVPRKGQRQRGIETPEIENSLRGIRTLRTKHPTETELCFQTHFA